MPTPIITVYLEVEADGKQRPYIEVAVSSQPGLSYRWGLWITQIDCQLPSPVKAPPGCFQYYPEATGELKNFSFDDGQYYVDQHYRMCLLAPPGTCSVTFSAPAGSFMLEKYGNIDEVPYNMSGMSSLYCVRDYLRIPDGSADGGAHTSSHDRYCGGHLASTHGAAAPSPVTSRVISKIVAVEFHAGIPHKFMAISHGPGFRVAYQHNHCAATDTFNQVKIQDSRRSRPSLVLPPPPILKVGGGHRQSYYRTRHHKVSAPPDLHGESPSTLVPQPSILATLMQSDGAGGDVEATAAEGVLDPGWSPHSIYRKRGPGYDSNPEASLPSYASRPSYSANASSRPRRPPPTLPPPYWMTSAEEITQATRLPSLPSLPAHPTPSKPILDNAQDTLGHPQDMINHQPQDFFGGP